MSHKVCWLSIDPVRRKVDIYPKAISVRLEKSFSERDPWAPSACILGSDFFNATVHFHPSGSCYQTTPGMSMGRAGFKQPGYRSVKRCIQHATDTTVLVYSKQVHGEWRIAASEEESDIRFSESVPAEAWIEAEAASANLADFKPWKGDDLTSNAWDASVVVWQWCHGVPERQGNLLTLGDEWWCPYLATTNAQIEEAFKAQADHVELSLASLDRRLRIDLAGDQSFALQRDEANNKERAVRRVIKTVQEVKVMLDRMTTPPVDISELVASLPAGDVPHHFYCAITQDIMQDPVKTSDGHTYDRSAILRWFEHAVTSPLTGLPLASTNLEPNTELRMQINDFVSNLTTAAQPAATAATTADAMASAVGSMTLN
uniref:U-box domain-containing protein n=1 Tax=Haptolina brevifila TaxID=156173 RepID=A0A6U7KI92_9EUKA|mmetsp:Transcript_68675/g.136025  ORF Transcript_68675/g.136025 Transcript_68675/m.136025 type:complete len:373 (+) Transcript_68675:212-1330(+)|eukprot:CAMPEP_0174708730 /NCGR_PEP_ID=MMETSP1094-20130205/10893_1 /TAXON_ID=156173 /ORGANISM="Chrysochromulina brevifilum, Strain UTEX LB 985" /LENGTH=372 /DNA_ID=CAMNT_0015907327 /DNA_START=209 /DNA_END=1327 /DNA_ORIENTATION=-